MRLFNLLELIMKILYSIKGQFHLLKINEASFSFVNLGKIEEGYNLRIKLG